MSENENSTVPEQSDAAALEEAATPQEEAPDTLRIMEALLFASDDLLTAARLKTVLPGNPDARAIRGMVFVRNRELGA